MIQRKYVFHSETNVSGNGNDYINMVNDNNLTMIISAYGSATSCTLTFYGKTVNENEYVPIKVVKTSDFAFSYTGGINEGYAVDLLSFSHIRVALSDVVGGNVTVVGQVISEGAR